MHSMHCIPLFRLIGRFKMLENISMEKDVGVTSEQLQKEKEEQGLSATKNFITLDNLKVDREEEAYWSLPTVQVPEQEQLVVEA